jgi:hypothetical protein
MSGIYPDGVTAADIDNAIQGPGTPRALHRLRRSGERRLRRRL